MSPVFCPSIFHCPSSSFLSPEMRQKKSSEIMAKRSFAGRHLPGLCTWLCQGCLWCAANSTLLSKKKKIGLAKEVAKAAATLTSCCGAWACRAGLCPGQDLLGLVCARLARCACTGASAAKPRSSQRRQRRGLPCQRGDFSC